MIRDFRSLNLVFARTQAEVLSSIENLSLDSTSTRLAAVSGNLGGRDFKTRVHNSETAKSAQTVHVLPLDVEEDAFLGFIKDVKAVTGEQHVVVNVHPDHQGLSPYCRICLC